MITRPRRSRVASLLTAAAVMATALAIPTAAFATRTIALSAGRFRFANIAPGQTVKGTVSVGNEGTEPLKVLVYAADQSVDASGNVTYRAPNRADLTAQTSPATWTNITMPADAKSLGNLPYLEMAPGKQIPIHFSVTVPQGVSPGDHNLMLFFEVFDTGKGTAQISGRLGARVSLGVQGATFEQMEIRPFNVESFILGDKVPYDFLVRNSGNVDERVTANVLLLDRSGNELGRQTPIQAAPVYANSNLAGVGVFKPSKLFGNFTVRVSVQQVTDAGEPIPGKAPMVKEQTTWMVPLWLLIAAGVLLVVLVVALIWMVASRSGARRQAKQARVAAPSQAPAGPDVDDSYHRPEQD